MVVQEIAAEPGMPLGEICMAIFRAVVERHDVLPWAVALLRPRTIAKTSSGKIQRGACREAFLADRLEILECRTGAGGAVEVNEPPPGGAPDEGFPPEVPARSTVPSILDWLRHWSEERLDSRQMDERRSMSPYTVLALGNRGLLGLVAGREYGGLGFSIGQSVRIFQQLAAIDLTLASFVLGQNWLGIYPIERHGAETLRRRLLPELAAGRQLSALAFTEPRAGSNLRAIASRGRWDPATACWRLEGTKTWSGTAAWAEALIVFVQIEGGPGGGRGITAFTLGRDAPGLSVGAESLTMGLRAMVQNSVSLRGVPAREADLLGSPGAGLAVAQEAFGRARIGLGAMAVGGMKRCAHFMVRYARGRDIATGRLLDHPVTLGRLGELGAAVTAVECLVDSAARTVDEGGKLPVDASMTCKIAGAEMLWRAADDLVQLLGGRGCAEPNLAAQLLRDARLLRILEGPTEVLTAHLGGRAADRGADLFRWLDERDAEVADDLRRAVGGVEGRSDGALAVFEVAQRRQWLDQRLGDAAQWAILRAAVTEGAARGEDAASLERAARWLKFRFEAAVKECTRATAAETVLLGAVPLATIVEEYVKSVGDLEPHSAAEELDFDPLLRRQREGVPVGGGEAPVEARPPAASAPVGESMPAPEGPTEPPRDGEVAAWLVDWISRTLQIPRAGVEIDAPFSTFLDSVTAVMMMGDLGSWLNVSLDAGLPWSHPSIESLSRRLAGQPTPETAAN